MILNIFKQSSKTIGVPTVVSINILRGEKTKMRNSRRRWWIKLQAIVVVKQHLNIVENYIIASKNV